MDKWNHNKETSTQGRNQQKAQTKWEKIFENHTFYKGLISRTCNELKFKKERKKD